MSVRLATYSYSFSASSYELHQNVYIGRSRHVTSHYDIRFSLGRTVWPLEVIKVLENGVPHSSFIYQPNRLKMHQTTCRGPRYGHIQHKPDWRIIRSKVKVKYSKNPIFKHGVPHSSFVYRPNRLKLHQKTCHGPSYWHIQQEPDWRIIRSKVKVKYAKNPIFKHGVPHSSFVYRPNRLKMHQKTCHGPSYWHIQQEPDWRIIRSKVKVKYAKTPIFKHGVPHSSFVYRPNRLKMHQKTCHGPSYWHIQQEPDWRTIRSKVKVKYAKNPIFKHGVPHSSFVCRPNRLKMHQSTCRGPSYGHI